MHFCFVTQVTMQTANVNSIFYKQRDEIHQTKNGVAKQKTWKQNIRYDKIKSLVLRMGSTLNNGIDKRARENEKHSVLAIQVKNTFKLLLWICKLPNLRKEWKIGSRIIMPYFQAIARISQWFYSKLQQSREMERWKKIHVIKSPMKIHKTWKRPPDRH